MYTAVMREQPQAAQILALSPATQQQFSALFLQEFIDYIDRKETTVKSYISCLKQFALWMNEQDITQPTRDDIKEYKHYLSACELATGTQQQYLRAVKQFFKWLSAEGKYPNIADNIHGAKVRHDMHKKDALQREDVAKIAASIDRSTEQGKRLYAMYMLCVICGLRTVELSRANIEDLKTTGGITYLYVQGKGHDDKDAPVLLIAEVCQAVNDYLQSRSMRATAKSPLFVSTSNNAKPGTVKEFKKDACGHFLLDDKGKKIPEKYNSGRIAPTTISTMLKDMLKAAGYDSDRLTAHSLRHTSGTGAHKAGLDLYSVQHLMRHCDPATSEIYIHDDNHTEAEQKGRQGIYDYYFHNAEITPVLPELERELMQLSEDEQRQILAEIRQRKERQTQ